MSAMADDRPAVVSALDEDIDLVAAGGAVLLLEHGARARPQRQSLRIAMTVRPDLRCRVAPAHERVVRRHATVIVQAHDLAAVAGQVLGVVRRVAVTDGDVQMTVRVHDHPGSPMRELGAGVVRDEQFGEVGQRGAPQPAAGQRGRGPVPHWFDVGQVDPPVVGKRGIDHHVEQAPAGRHVHARPAGDGRDGEIVEPQQVQLPVALGENHRPRVGEVHGPDDALAPQDFFDPQPHAFGFEDFRLAAGRIARHAGARHGVGRLRGDRARRQRQQGQESCRCLTPNFRRDLTSVTDTRYCPQGPHHVARERE